MVIPPGNAFFVQSFNVVTRKKEGFKIKETIGVRFVPLTWRLEYPGDVQERNLKNWNIKVFL